jgi:hypothetical protein
MTFTRPALSGPAWFGLAAIALLAQGCTQQATWNGIFAVDTVGGAKTCVAAPASPADGQTVQSTIQVSNEGGWCGILANRGGRPYDSYLIVTRPTHGKVFAHRVGTNTRIDYTPDRGYAGTDVFAIRMIPGDSIIPGAVTVTR